MTVVDTERTELILTGRNRVLTELATGAPLPSILDELTRAAEEVIPDMCCSVLLLDGTRLHCGSGPSLPGFYLRAIDGFEIGPDVGSCGAAAYTGKRVVVEDVQTHPFWAAFRELAARAGLRACWSEPIFSPTGEILGTLAMYYHTVRRPDDFELAFIHTTAQVAGFSIAARRTERSLRDSEELFRQLAENITEVFWLTDWIGNHVLYVSPAYEQLWGVSCESLLEDGRSWTQAIHPEDRERVFQAFREHAAKGTYDEEYRLVRPDGEPCWVRDRAFPIYDESGEVYRIAGISEDITPRKRVEVERRAAQEAREERARAQLESLTGELLLAEERERRALARDLHDGLGQTITLARMKLGALAGKVPHELQGELALVERLIDEADRSARSLTFQISPPVLYDLGFEAALEWLVEDIQESYGLAIELEQDRRPKPLDERARVLLYRAVRELLINVAKHAEARSARVGLHREGERLRIAVEDDGSAFDPEAVGHRGLGLRSIQERLSHLGGSMEIRSQRGRGTSVTLMAPLMESRP